MSTPVRIVGVGLVRVPDTAPAEAGDRASRLRAALAALSAEGTPVRLLHGIEEMAVLAAHGALSSSGMPMPYRNDDLGVVLGVEEGIDGIKAEYYRGILKDGLLGASPIMFPFTTPNTVAARISILLDLRGESFTLCGGTLSGAQAIGLAMNAVREAWSPAMLAGGVTSVGREFLDALARTGRPDDGQAGSGACLFLLEPSTSSGGSRGTGELLGYAEGFGREDVRDAVQACLEDAGVRVEQVKGVWVTAGGDARALLEPLRRFAAKVPVRRPPAPSLYAASFPLAVAEAVQAADAIPGPVLVIGRDCLAGASAALVRGRAPR